MDVLKFIEERDRMCSTYFKCENCPLVTTACMNIVNVTEQVVDIVEKWSAAHPCKTRQSEFLKQYPDTLLDSCGVIEFCPMPISASHRTNHGDCNNPEKLCRDCRKEFWSQEME